jgi:hypothetical protein
MICVESGGRLGVAPAALVILIAATACSKSEAPAVQIAAASVAAGIRPYASLQEVMDGIIDPAADELWGSVETTVTSQAVQEKQPHTPDEWAEVRRKAITLIEASNLLAIEGRQVGAKPFPAEAAGALDSAQIQQRIADERAVFVGFTGSLRTSAQQALAAIDAKDPVALVKAGGALDGVCEGCHMTFWYPNQVIPPLP